MKIIEILTRMSFWMMLLLVAGLCQVSVVRGDEVEDEDIIEGEEDDGEASVESEGEGGPSVVPGDLTSEGEKEEEDYRLLSDYRKNLCSNRFIRLREEKEVSTLVPSPDAETILKFIKPTVTEFPAGHPVRFIVGFRNKGIKDFIVESMDAAFRYPQDYSYYIQSFTAVVYQQTVEPNHDATFEYSFLPSDSFSARPFGLTINLNYKDVEGNQFQDAVFNSTINVTEPDEGFNGETFFLYVFLAAVLVLVFVGLYQLFNTYGKRRLIPRSRPVIELGTQSKSDVDYEWLPDNLLNDINRSSPKSGKLQKTPPRQRKPRNHADGVN